MDVKYPQVKVKLVGEDGNAFSILGRVTKALRRAKVSEEEINLFRKEATSGDYNNLLATVMNWVGEEEPEDDDNDDPGFCECTDPTCSNGKEH